MEAIKLVFGVGVLISPWQISFLKADNIETRDYSVMVDNKSVGHNRITIKRQDDGTTIVSNQSQVRVKILLINYSYSYQGTEIWKNYQLLRLNGKCNDNRKHHMVSAALGPQGKVLQVNADGKSQALQPEVWTTSYWKLPAAKYHNKALILLDADKGEVIKGQLRYVGTEKKQIAGKNQTCYHFKVTGPKTPVDLWFDVQHRLVRQEFVELGHRTVIEMVSLNRNR